MSYQPLLNFELVLRMFNLMLQELLAERIVIKRLRVVRALCWGTALASGPPLKTPAGGSSLARLQRDCAPMAMETMNSIRQARQPLA